MRVINKNEKNFYRSDHILNIFDINARSLYLMKHMIGDITISPNITNYNKNTIEDNINYINFLSYYYSECNIFRVNEEIVFIHKNSIYYYNIITKNIELLSYIFVKKEYEERFNYYYNLNIEESYKLELIKDNIILVLNDKFLFFKDQLAPDCSEFDKLFKKLKSTIKTYVNRNKINIEYKDLSNDLIVLDYTPLDKIPELNNDLTDENKNTLNILKSLKERENMRVENILNVELELNG